MAPIERSTEDPLDLDSASLTRRGFMVRAAALGLTAAAAPAFLAACARAVTPTADPTATALAFPTPTPLAPPTPSAAPTATLVPKPTATPRPALDTETARVSHLLRRAGFGASRSELDRFIAMGVPATVDYLIDYQNVDDSDLEAFIVEQEFDLDRLRHLQAWWLTRMIRTKRPLQEKMTLFWHGILTSSFRKAGKGLFMLSQNQLYRERALGRYDELLKLSSRDPAMLLWLDSRSNKKKAPNENYARELMELFTLGLTYYSEEDVRESARAFTGWGLRRHEFFFNKRQHDFGEKTFLGRTGNWDGDDVIDIIMAQPIAAEFIVRKLWEFFAYDDPAPELIARLADLFRESGTEIKPVVRAILTSPEFYSDRAAAAKVKSPTEYVATMVRSLDVQFDPTVLRRSMEPMGQTLFVPPNVAGWAGGATWINSSTLLMRINFANFVATARGRRLRFLPVELVAGRGFDRPADYVDFFAELLLASAVAPADRNLLVAFLEALDDATITQPTLSLDDRLRALVYLMAASPGHQLA